MMLAPIAWAVPDLLPQARLRRTSATVCVEGRPLVRG
jgi:hypothetical protein